MTESEEKLFILDLLRLNLDLLRLNTKETVYTEETVINIIKQVLKVSYPKDEPIIESKYTGYTEKNTEGGEWNNIISHPEEQGEDEEAPKYPTSWRDFTMTDKSKIETQQEQLDIPVVSGSKEYKNIPPKDIMNAIWGACFDYKDFEYKILDETIQDRVYDAWQRIHQCIDGWINADEKNFIDYIKQNKPDLEQ